VPRSDAKVFAVKTFLYFHVVARFYVSQLASPPARIAKLSRRKSCKVEPENELCMNELFHQLPSSQQGKLIIAKEKKDCHFSLRKKKLIKKLSAKAQLMIFLARNAHLHQHQHIHSPDSSARWPYTFFHSIFPPQLLPAPLR